MLWSHIPCMIMVYGTLYGPQNDIGNYLGPFSTHTPRYAFCQVIAGIMKRIDKPQWLRLVGFVFHLR